MAAGDAGRRKNKIDGQFVAITRAILECPARRALSLAARRALEKIEIEHLVHGGKDNGKLPVTYRDFEKWLVRPDTIASAIRELVALGFVEVTRHGYGRRRKACAKPIPLDVYRCLGHSQSRSDRNTRISANCYPRRSRSHCEGCPQRCRRQERRARQKTKRHPTNRGNFAPHFVGQSRPTKRGLPAQSVPPHKTWVSIYI